MYDTSEFRKGLRVEIDKVPYSMMDVQFVKPGKGQAFSRVKLKNLLTGLVLERTYKSGEKLASADVVDTEMAFLYAAEGVYHFMNNQNYEQLEVEQSRLDESWKYLTEGMVVTVTLFNSIPIGVTLPNFSVLEVQSCDPAVKGDTVNNATKRAIMQTGAELQVPLFVESGDKVKIDTRTGLYVGRTKD